MNYQQTIDYLFSQLPMYQRIGPAAYRANLDNTIALSKHLGNPEKKFRSIHIAGTNGKGSVAHMLASVLRQAGYKTGLATSPHLKDFRERIKINGALIPKDYVVEFVEKNSAFFEKLRPSFFEMTMALTFEYFASEGVDAAVIETGLGGRLDSSNIINPELSVITNIGFDHTHLLGDSLEKIAAEKAGIIKEGVPVVIGRTQAETFHVFQNVSKKKQSRLIAADSLFHVLETKTISFEGVGYTRIELGVAGETQSVLIDLQGQYQAENLVCAMTAIQVLNLENKYELSEEAVKTGLRRIVANTGMQGRWQQIGDQPKVICDAAHNADGMKYVVKQLGSMIHDRLHIVFGMVDDKERAAILKLLPSNGIYYFCNPSVPRGLKAEILAGEAINYGLKGLVYKSVREALDNAKMNASENDLIFVGGSTFVVAEVL
jgi:dihydrofolate synthase / folylpolyglutamate synthase